MTSFRSLHTYIQKNMPNLNKMTKLLLQQQHVKISCQQIRPYGSSKYPFQQQT